MKIELSALSGMLIETVDSKWIGASVRVKSDPSAAARSRVMVDCRRNRDDSQSTWGYAPGDVHGSYDVAVVDTTGAGMRSAVHWLFDWREGPELG